VVFNLTLPHKAYLKYYNLVISLVNIEYPTKLEDTTSLPMSHFFRRLLSSPLHSKMLVMWNESYLSPLLNHCLFFLIGVQNKISSQGSCPPPLTLEPSSPPLITSQHSTHRPDVTLPGEFSSSSPSFTYPTALDSDDIGGHNSWKMYSLYLKSSSYLQFFNLSSATTFFLLHRLISVLYYYS